MNLNKSNHNAQVGLEFLILSSFLLVLVAVILGITGYFLSSFNEADLDKEREEFAQTIQMEFQNALNSPSGFRRSFSISRDDQQRFNVTFYSGFSYFTLNDFRKYGPDSDRQYFYGIGGDFRFNENFFAFINTSDPVNYLVISFELLNEEDLVKVDLQPLKPPSSTILPTILLGFNFDFITPPTPISYTFATSTVNISTNLTSNDHLYSFINFDNSLVGWWRFEEVPTTLLFHDNFSIWEGWNQYLNGIVEYSNQRAKIGTHSLKKITYGNPNGGYKHLGAVINRDFELTVWIGSEEPRTSNVFDRISLTNSDHRGYGFRVTPTSVVIENVTESKIYGDSFKDLASTTLSWTRPNVSVDEWYRVRFSSDASTNNLSVSVFFENGTFVGSTSVIDSEIQFFDRVNIRGGRNYFIDNLSITATIVSTPDESGNNNDARVSGSSLNTNGAFGNSIEFNGVDNFLEVQNRNDFIMNESFTLSTWVKFNDNSTPLPANQFDFITGNGGSWDEIGFMLFRCKLNQTADPSHYCDKNPGVIRWEIRENSSNREFIDSSSSITTDMNWVHVVGVYNDEVSQMRLYINGILENTTVANFGVINSSNFFGMGNLSATLLQTTPLNGSIDDTLLFRRALSTQEVESLFNGSNKVNSVEFNGLDTDKNYSFQAFAINESGQKYSTEKRFLESNCAMLPGGEWILVPGNSYFGTDDFCVMKYEAKAYNRSSSSFIANGGASETTPGWADLSEIEPYSVAGNLPWVNINFTTAWNACNNLNTYYSGMGGNFRLITNRQWMSIARDIENNSFNWADGVVGSLVSSGGGLFRGNVGLNNGISCGDGSILDSLTPGVNCVISGGIHDGRNKRTLELSNGEEIWDLSGNIRQWVDAQEDTSTLNGNACDGINAWYNFSGTNECVWQNGYSKNVTVGPDKRFEVGPLEAINTNHGIGAIYSSNTPNRVFLRGGFNEMAHSAGIYALALHDGYPILARPEVRGFRCSYEP